MTSVKRGRTLKLYLVDGTPTGIITAQLGISTIVATVASRTDLPELIERDDARKTGVYVLSGPDPSDVDRLQIYIGETGDVSKRLVEHDSDEKRTSSLESFLLRLQMKILLKLTDSIWRVV